MAPDRDDTSRDATRNSTHEADDGDDGDDGDEAADAADGDDAAHAVDADHVDDGERNTDARHADGEEESESEDRSPMGSAPEATADESSDATQDGAGGDGEAASDGDVGGISYGATPTDGASGSDDDGDDLDASEDSDRLGDHDDNDDNVDPTGSTDVEDVETFLVDSDDVVECMAHNGQLEDARLGKAVFRLDPPFEATVEPRVEYIDDDYSEEVDDGLHVRAFRFVDRGREVLEQRPTRSLARERLGDDADDEAVAAWVEAATETWADHVREHLLEKVDVYSSHGMTFVDVRYVD